MGRYEIQSPLSDSNEELTSENLSRFREKIYESVASVIGKYMTMGDLPEGNDLGEWKGEFKMKRDDVSRETSTIEDAQILEENEWSLENYEMEISTDNGRTQVRMEDVGHITGEYVDIEIIMPHPNELSSQSDEIRMFEDFQDQKSSLV